MCFHGYTDVVAKKFFDALKLPVYRAMGAEHSLAGYNDRDVMTFHVECVDNGLTWTKKNGVNVLLSLSIEEEHILNEIVEHERAIVETAEKYLEAIRVARKRVGLSPHVSEAEAVEWARGYSLALMDTNIIYRLPSGSWGIAGYENTWEYASPIEAAIAWVVYKR